MLMNTCAGLPGMILIASCPVDCGILDANFRRAVGLVGSLFEQTVGGDARHGAVKRRNPALIVGQEARRRQRRGEPRGQTCINPRMKAMRDLALYPNQALRPC
jgi:hypothetical protein